MVKGSEAWRTLMPSAMASATVAAAPELHGSRYATFAAGSAAAGAVRPGTTGVDFTLIACALVSTSTSNSAARFHAVTS